MLVTNIKTELLPPQRGRSAWQEVRKPPAAGLVMAAGGLHPDTEPETWPAVRLQIRLQVAQCRMAELQ